MSEISGGRFGGYFGAARRRQVTRRRALPALVGLATVLVLGLSALVAPAAMAATTGSITGTVTTAPSTGIQNIEVDVFDARGNFVSTTCTAANGSYTVSGLTPANYEVEFVPGSAGGDNACGVDLNYVSQYYNGASALSTATPVAVTSGGTATGIDATMAPGGSISGTVTDAATKANVANVEVDVFDSNDNFVGFACTNSSGGYTVSGLGTESYTVEFTGTPQGGGVNGCGAILNYVSQYYNDQSSFQSANPVSVTAGQTTSGINAAMQAGGSISGTVTDASTKADVANIEVDVFDSNDNQVGTACTDPSGGYSISGLQTGSYVVEFSGGSGSVGECGPNLNYVAQYYNDQSSFASANPVSVTVAKTTSGIDAAMQAGGSISGTVTDAATKAGVANVEVDVFDSNDNPVGSTCTDSSGAYTVSGLGTGSYVVEFAASGFNGGCGAPLDYASQYYNDESSFQNADPVSVTAGQTTSGIDAAMLAGGSITGTVTDAVTKADVPNVEVDVFDSNGDFAGTACTDTSGGYTVTGLGTGNYEVEFAGSSQGGGPNQCGATLSYVTQFYNDESSYGSANPVSVTAAQTTSGINAAMQAGGSISGTVTDAVTKADVPNVEVDVYDSNDNFVASACTDGSGGYTIPGLLAGSYEVGFNGANTCGASVNYVSQYYNDQSTLQSADAVSVAAGKTTSGINAAMEPGLSISGTVTDKSNTNPIQNVEVDVYDSSQNVIDSVCTGSDGTYTATGLTPGTYYVGFTGAPFGACGQLGLNYVTQYYNGKSSLASATPLSLTSGKNATGINASMQPGGQITGTVTDASTHAGVANVEVDAYDSNHNLIATACTVADGTYRLEGLTTGSFYVGFSTPQFGECSATSQYVTQYYNDKASLTAATAISVTEGSTTQSINAALTSASTTNNLTITPAGNGSGTVTSSPSGIDCGGVCSAPYATGSDVTLTESPASGSTFAGWSGGGCSGTATTCTVTMNADQTVTATFSTGSPPPPTTYTLTVQKSGGGSGTVTSGDGNITCGSTCSHGGYSSGANVTLTASPASGSTFAGWSGGGCSGTATTCTVTMSANQTVTATFNTGAPPPSAPSCTIRPKSSSVLVKSKSKKTAAKLGKLTLTITCNQNASVSVRGKVTITGKKPRHGRAKTHTVSVGPAGRSARANVPLTLTIKLPGSAIAGLKSGEKVSVVFTLVATNSNGTGHATATIARLHGT